MKQVGIVENVNGDMVTVRIKRASACGENCASCKGGCTPTEQIVSARNDAGAKKGDSVVLQMDSKYVLFAAFLVYILPLAALFCVYAAVFVFTEKEGVSALLGILAMTAVFAAVRILDKKLKDKYILIAAYCKM